MPNKQVENEFHTSTKYEMYFLIYFFGDELLYRPHMVDFLFFPFLDCGIFSILQLSLSIILKSSSISIFPFVFLNFCDNWDCLASWGGLFGLIIKLRSSLFSRWVFRDKGFFSPFERSSRSSSERRWGRTWEVLTWVDGRKQFVGPVLIEFWKPWFCPCAWVSNNLLPTNRLSSVF